MQPDNDLTRPSPVLRTRRAASPPPPLIKAEPRSGSLPPRALGCDETPRRHTTKECPGAPVANRKRPRMRPEPNNDNNHLPSGGKRLRTRPGDSLSEGDEEPGDRAKSRVRVVLHPPVRGVGFPTLPEPWGDSHDYVLSRRLVHHLDDRDPGLLLARKPYAQQKTERWSDAVLLRSAFVGGGPEPSVRRRHGGVDDAIFMHLLPGFAAALLDHGDLLVRIEALEYSIFSIRGCLRWMAQQFVRDGILIPRGDADIDQIMASRRRSLDAWAVWGYSAKDASTRQLWKNVLTYKDDDHSGTKRICGQPPDELRPLWYLILSELGFSTGAPDPLRCPKLADPDCLPSLVVLAPTKVGLYAESLDKEADQDRIVSPTTFVGAIERLDMLSRVKMRGMLNALRRRAPELILLWDAGFRPELTRMAMQLRSRRIMGERLAKAIERAPESGLRYAH